MKTLLITLALAASTNTAFAYCPIGNDIAAWSACNQAELEWKEMQAQQRQLLDEQKRDEIYFRDNYNPGDDDQ
jgi:hypothetical protein